LSTQHNNDEISRQKGKGMHAQARTPQGRPAPLTASTPICFAELRLGLRA